MDALVVPVAAALLLAGLLIGWVLVRQWRPLRTPRPSGAPVPDSWRRLIEGRVPLTRRLTALEWTRLLDLVQSFIGEKHFEGVDGLSVTEEMKVIVAAQACLLVLHLDAGAFPGVRSVIFYPGTFVPRLPELTDHLFSGVAPQPEPSLGEYRRGVIVLSWESVEMGSVHSGDGRNVVLHEFAHQLDQEDGYVDGIPLLEAPSSTREWARVLQARFEELRRSAMEGVPDVLSAYGATNRAEFFAVATEAFFERPNELRDRHPDLYRELKGFYRQDPADVTGP